MISDATQIRDWYKLIKENSTCLCDKRAGLPPLPGRVEYHHYIGCKLDTLSSMAIKPCILPMRYSCKPVTFAMELMKVVPLSPDNHKALHKADDRGDIAFLRDRFDFNRDPFYKQEIRSFRTMALDLAPKPILNKVHDGLLDMLEAGRIVMTAAGFELVANDNAPSPAGVSYRFG